MARPIIVHRFYAGDKCVLISEWYEPMSVDQLKERAQQAVEWGYGDPDIVTDSTGRLVRLKEVGEEQQ
ncbi:hypothetical protein [Paenibacillus sp. FSL P2-0173]|uniref:hypothetical protein n=1 Tax=Paenibacillus sp. FSL P2-0173 TaxID=2921627 RepID=UPI0030FB7C49